MKRVFSIAVVLALFTAQIGWGQTIVNNVIFRGPAPNMVAGVTAQPTGVRGASTIYYWVTARYPIGVTVMAQPAQAIGTMGIANLVTSPVRVTWQAAPGATGYDVIRLATSQFPVAGVCVACVVVSNTAATTYLDNVVVAANNWPTAGTVIAASATLSAVLNNRDDSYPYLAFNGEVHIMPLRSNLAYSYLYEIGGLMTGGAVQKTYALGINVTRPPTAIATGDSNDALVRGSYSNYAKNDANFLINGINTSVSNRSPGTMGILQGGNISASNKSGATSPFVKGLFLSVENFGTTTTEFSGLEVSLKNEGAKASLEYGVKVRNDNNSLGTAADAAYMVRSSAGLANLGFQYGLDMNGATIGTAELRTSRGNVIYSGNGAPAAGQCAAPTLGSIYLNLAGGAATSLYVCEVAGAWAGK